MIVLLTAICTSLGTFELLFLTVSSFPCYRQKVKLSRIKKVFSSYHNDDLHTPYLSELIQVADEISVNNRYFFPGHSGRYLPFKLDKSLDLPELETLASVHCPSGALKKSLELAANLYGAKKTWFLLNGSTSGVLAAVLAVVKLHRRRHIKNNMKNVLILGRDSHKSAFDALSIADCDAVVLPCIVENKFHISVGSFVFENIKQALTLHGPNVCGVLLTRPTYQGVGCSTEDMKKISQLCHEFRVPVLIDEAHGSHIRFLDLEEFQDGISCECDIVIQSTHKTLTSLSQTGMMHLSKTAFEWYNHYHNVQTYNNSGNGQNDDEVVDMIQQCYSMFTTTSANSLLIGSLDASRALMSSSQGLSILKASVDVANDLRQTCRGNSHSSHQSNSPIMLLDDSPLLKRLHWIVDPLRITIRFQGESAVEVDEQMCDQDGIYCELNLEDCITYAINFGSTTETVQNLKCSLLKQYERITHSKSFYDTHVNASYRKESDNIDLLSQTMTLGYIMSEKSNNLDTLTPLLLPLDNCLNCISADTICLYPPGIPILVKGEVISNHHIDDIRQVQKNDLGQGRSVTGAKDSSLKLLNVYKI